ncbi:hypothetical protein AGDE_00680 [Angomonas deanei]|uniref:Uncharacterized protein n=1 Tax=Angomonas deanei TaxID=59799 RepID=A0A7G2CGI0_9TRYP|nr:hypothetical protein AGDE_00680 [Angomonas deanei]CAD2218609.1 hypothetical protein, conserved [Angomonas deanei]|eukprot:EPY43242.1 hypothetical protein AGDE_00680 [Angomonas deanei]
MASKGGKTDTKITNKGVDRKHKRVAGPPGRDAVHPAAVLSLANLAGTVIPHGVVGVGQPRVVHAGTFAGDLGVGDNGRVVIVPGRCGGRGLRGHFQVCRTFAHFLVKARHGKLEVVVSVGCRRDVAEFARPQQLDRSCLGPASQYKISSIHARVLTRDSIEGTAQRHTSGGGVVVDVGARRKRWRRRCRRRRGGVRRVIGGKVGHKRDARDARGGDHTRHLHTSRLHHLRSGCLVEEFANDVDGKLSLRRGTNGAVGENVASLIHAHLYGASQYAAGGDFEGKGILAVFERGSGRGRGGRRRGGRGSRGRGGRLRERVEDAEGNVGVAHWHVITVYANRVKGVALRRWSGKGELGSRRRNVELSCRLRGPYHHVALPVACIPDCRGVRGDAGREHGVVELTVLAGRRLFMQIHGHITTAANGVGLHALNVEGDVGGSVFRHCRRTVRIPR